MQMVIPPVAAVLAGGYIYPGFGTTTRRSPIRSCSGSESADLAGCRRVGPVVPLGDRSYPYLRVVHRASAVSH